MTPRLLCWVLKCTYNTKMSDRSRPDSHIKSKTQWPYFYTRLHSWYVYESAARVKYIITDYSNNNLLARVSWAPATHVVDIGALAFFTVMTCLYFVVLYMYNNIILSLIHMAGIFGIIESQLFDRINKK